MSMSAKEQNYREGDQKIFTMSTTGVLGNESLGIWDVGSSGPHLEAAINKDPRNC